MTLSKPHADNGGLIQQARSQDGQASAPSNATSTSMENRLVRGSEGLSPPTEQHEVHASGTKSAPSMMPFVLWNWTHIGKRQTRIGTTLGNL